MPRAQLQRVGEPPAHPALPGAGQRAAYTMGLPSQIYLAGGGAGAGGRSSWSMPGSCSASIPMTRLCFSHPCWPIISWCHWRLGRLTF